MNIYSRAEAINRLILETNELHNQSVRQLYEIENPNAFPMGAFGPIGMTLGGWSELRWAQGMLKEIAKIQRKSLKLINGKSGQGHRISLRPPKMRDQRQLTGAAQVRANWMPIDKSKRTRKR